VFDVDHVSAGRSRHIISLDCRCLENVLPSAVDNSLQVNRDGAAASESHPVLQSIASGRDVNFEY
jgi:hypothetical protein